MKNNIRRKIRDLICFPFTLFPEILLLKIAKFIYSPKPLRPFPGWVVGSGYYSNISSIIRIIIWESLKIKGIKKDLIVNWHNDIKIVLHPGREIDECVYMGGQYEPNEFYFLNKALKPEMIFIDVGANIGLYSLFASKIVGEKGFVLAIEPSEREVKYLKNNIFINNIQNIYIIEEAVTDKIGKAKLLIAAEGKEGHNTLGAFVDDAVKIEKTQLVDTTTLDNLVTHLNLNRVDFIKLDIEGAELLALRGAENAILKFFPVIIMELSDLALQRQNCNTDRVWNFFRNLNYEIYIFDNKTGYPVKAQERDWNSGNIIALPQSKINQLNETITT